MVQYKSVVRVTKREKALLAAIRATGTLTEVSALVTATAPKAPKAWKVECAYGSASCAGRKFLPHGTGSTQHTSCAEGIAAIKAAK